MRSARLFFTPIIKVLLFVLVSLGGAEILYSEVLFPNYQFLPFEIYNPVLDLTKDRFLFRMILLGWGILLYLFLQFILSKHKLKDLIIINEENKVKNFFKGSCFGVIFFGFVLFFLTILNFNQITEFLVFTKDTFLILCLYLITIFASCFFFELIFRATVLNYLKDHLNIHVANLMTSTIFAAIFVFSNSDYYPIKQFLFSLFLGYTFFKYGFYATFGFHFGWNYLESIFFSNKILKINLVRQEDFTPLTENSLISIIILLVSVIIYLLQFTKSRKKISK
jgi:membrane protease YdiL (CAAX protease family)